MTINTLADRYAAAKAVADAALAEVEALKKEIKALGQETVEGRSCFVKIGLSERNTLDARAVETKLGAAWVKAHSKTTIVERLTIKNKPVGTLVRAAIEQLEEVA